jgi:hypothetical protein
VLVLETHPSPTGVPFAIEFDKDSRVLTLSVRNVGRGPALSISMLSRFLSRRKRRSESKKKAPLPGL